MPDQFAEWSHDVQSILCSGGAVGATPRLTAVVEGCLALLEKVSVTVSQNKTKAKRQYHNARNTVVTTGAEFRARGRGLFATLRDRNVCSDSRGDFALLR
jgi:hypothetical protein